MTCEREGDTPLRFFDLTTYQINLASCPKKSPREQQG